MNRQGTPLCLLAACLLLLVLGGCGGGSGTGPAPIPDGDGDDGGGVASSEMSTAHFLVDVESGDVTVTHSSAADGMMESAAAFSGTAVHFDSSVLYDQPGNIGLKILDVSLTNRMGFAMGQTPAGIETGVRVLFSDIRPVKNLLDIRSETQVSTIASLSVRPWGAAVEADGSVYVTVPHQVLKINGGNISVVAGGTSSGYLNRVGTAARFDEPAGVAVNPVDGALIVAEQNGNRIRRIDRSGSASLVAGTGTAGNADGRGDVAQFAAPVGVAVNRFGDIYVTDSHRIRRISLTGANPSLSTSYTVTTLAGSSAAGFADANGIHARFNAPLGISVDEDGNIYVADSGNRRIRMSSSDGRVTTIAGTGALGRDDGTGDVATFRTPYGVAALPDRGRGVSLVVSDELDRVLRQVSLNDGGTASPGSAGSWLVQTLAGTYGTAGTTDGPGDVARFNASRLLAADGNGSVYVPDYGGRLVRLVLPNEGFFPIDTPDGGPLMENIQLANADGWVPCSGGSNRPFIAYPAIGRGGTSDAQIWAFTVPHRVTAFQFSVIVSAQTEAPTPPEGVDADMSGGTGSPRSMVRTLAGSTAGVNGFIDGGGANARFRCIIGIGFDTAGNALVADAENNAIRLVTPDGRVATVGGSSGTSGYVNGLGNAARFNYPTDVAVVQGDYLAAGCGLPTGPDGMHILVTDLDNDRIRIIRAPFSGWTATSPWEPWNPAFYEVGTAAGDGTSAYANGTGDVAQFAAPSAVAMGPGGTFYVLERGGNGNRVRTLRWTGGDPMSPINWRVELLAGAVDGSSGYVDASGSSARFNDPRGIAVGPDGMIYVADTYNHCIRKITPDGDVTTLAGTNSSGYSDAAGNLARFYAPWDVCVGPDGYLYVADRYNYRIRRVSPVGVVSTVAGTGSTTRLDGRGNTSGHHDDLGIGISPSGDLYIGEAECVRVIERIIDAGGV